MIYDFSEPSSPIGQGDIFFGVPIPDLTDNELPTIDDECNAQALPWESFASAGESVSAIISVRPTIAIVGTQECDALRAPNITLFEVRPFRDVERKSKDTSKPSKWVPLITQHARINQKWFYLPADERLGFSEKMGADFLTPIRVPRLTLERLIGFRKGRLNEVAKQHFRERLAEFFRRYAYDEWYPLTREELAEYQKNHPDAEPFPWQREQLPSNEETDQKNKAIELSGGKGVKTSSDYLVELNRARSEFHTILITIASEMRSLIAKLRRHNTSLSRLDSNPEGEEATQIYRVVASDRNAYSEKLERILPEFEKGIEVLEKSYTLYFSSLKPEPSQHTEIISQLRNNLSDILTLIKPAKESIIKSRNNALVIKNSFLNLNEELSSAASRESEALDTLIPRIEGLESFALKMIFLIEENFGKSQSPENTPD